jgi:hypothetical protein
VKERTREIRRDKLAEKNLIRAMVFAVTGKNFKVTYNIFRVNEADIQFT